MKTLANFFHAYIRLTAINPFRKLVWWMLVGIPVFGTWGILTMRLEGWLHSIFGIPDTSEYEVLFKGGCFFAIVVVPGLIAWRIWDRYDEHRTARNLAAYREETARRLNQ
jgi:hypothetical protein